MVCITAGTLVLLQAAVENQVFTCIDIDSEYYKDSEVEKLTADIRKHRRYKAGGDGPVGQA